MGKKAAIGFVCFGEVASPIERLRMKHDEALGVLKGLGYEPVDGGLVMITHEAKIIKKIYELHEKGLTPYKIAKLLNGAGISTRKFRMWSGGTVQGILNKREFYEGTYKYGGIECRGDYEPLIVDGEWRV